MGAWHTKNLGDVLKLKRGFDLPTSQRTPGPFPVVGSAGISGWHTQGPVLGPGVVVGRAGAAMGKATYVTENFWPLNTALFVEDFLGNVPRFIYALLSSIDFSGYNSGAAHPMLNRNYIQNIRVMIPGPEEQSAISRVLGSLEDRISLNGKISHTAGNLASALASSARWPGATPLSSLATLNRTQVQPSELAASHVDHYSIPAYDKGAGPERASPLSIKSSKFLIKRPCVLVAKLNPETSRAWPVLAVAEISSLASTEFLVLEPRQNISTEELWSVIHQRDFFAELSRRAGGTSRSHQRVRPETVLSTLVVNPETMDVETRHKITSLLSRAETARRENRTLSALRDTLLPQLVTGKIRIKDAERAVEESV